MNKNAPYNGGQITKVYFNQPNYKTMKKFIIKVAYTETIEAEDEEQATQKFLEGIENEPQQTTANFIEDHLTIKEATEKINLSLGDINEVEADKYAQRYAEMIKNAGTEMILISIINKIYNDGYEDGADSEK